MKIVAFGDFWCFEVDANTTFAPFVVVVLPMSHPTVMQATLSLRRMMVLSTEEIKMIMCCSRPIWLMKWSSLRELFDLHVRSELGR